MLRFFRSIRKKLIEQDNIRKYLLYAVGEILLVVIGILIALQVNNWNEERLENQKEEKIISRLHTEFTNNHEELLITLARIDSSRTALEVLLDLEKNGFESDKSVDEWNHILFNSLQTPTWNPSSYVLSDLKNGGRISSLNDEELVKLLFSWERLYDNAVENTSNFKRILEIYLDYMIDSGLIRSVNKDFGITSNPLDTDVVPLMKEDPFLFNLIHEKLLLTTVVTDEYEGAKAVLEEIIEKTK